MASTAVFVDFDGTITDVDTFNLLGRSAVGEQRWDEIDRQLDAGRISLREALRQQAAAVRLSRAASLAFLESHAQVDPTFGPFVAAVRAQGWTIRVVSCGVTTLIRHALGRAGIAIDVYANDVDFAESGWTMSFVDDSENGHDKARHVREARAAGRRTIYVGDGISDFQAIDLADLRFVKAGSSLERYCASRGVSCTPFADFAEIARAVF